MLTWPKPTKNGASPAKNTWAGAPPTVTVGVRFAVASGEARDAAPL